MPTLAAVIEAVSNLAKLGASEGVQKLLIQEMAILMGVPQAVLDAAIKAAKDAPPPRRQDG